MVVLGFTDVGISTITKAAMTGGMSNFVFVVYYNGLGTLILLPQFIFNRSKRAPLTFSLLCVFFLFGLIGSLGQVFVYTGIKYSSPTLSSALENLIPVFTFSIAVIFRMESLDLRRSSSGAKCLGTIIAVSGALMVTFYKGPSIYMASRPSNFSLQLISLSSNWVFGGLLIALGCLLAAVWYVVQAIFGSVFRSSIHTWYLHKKGPVYVAMFSPLGIVIAVVLGVTFLKDTLHIGSVIGAIIIALGFYTVLWDNLKKKTMDLVVSNYPTPKRPLFYRNKYRDYKCFT